MNKYAFVVYHREYESFLHTLRDLGVLHIKETNSIADNEELQHDLAERKRINSTLRYFDRLNAAEKEVNLSPARILDAEKGLKLIADIDEVQEKKIQKQTLKQSLQKDIAYMELWGDFSYSYISRLQRAGYMVTFFSCSTSKFEPQWIEDYNAILINTFQSVNYFVTITPAGTKIDIDAEYPKMPDMGLSKLKTRSSKVDKDIKALDSRLKQYATTEYNTIQELDKHFENKFNFGNALVQANKEADDKLMLLEGWTTEDKVKELESNLDNLGYFFKRLDIEEEDKVPILLKNDAFSKLYEPITKMFSLPNYTELDPTPLFAPFFMLFFGLCFGDGGYGLIILLGCTLLKKKVNSSFKPYLSLFQYLGLATIIVGILTGSFFGIALVDVPAFKSVKNYFLNSDNLMTLSIVIGIIHILFGKCVSAVKTKMQQGTKYSIAPFAWIFVIVSLVCVLGLPILEIHLSDTVVKIGYSIAALGLIVAFLYNSPGKNIFLNFGTGLWNTYNIASGLLGDTLSYIRLFAIGLTGSILGGVFNSLSTTMTEGLSIVPRLIVMLLILLVGHGINFSLCMISSLVHPLRLIFVEYYKNSEFEGGGKAYVPFKKA